MAAHNVHFLLEANEEAINWLLSLGKGFMEGYGLRPDSMEDFEVSYEKLMKGLPSKPFTVCFETDDEELAIMFKLRFADFVVDERDV